MNGEYEFTKDVQSRFLALLVRFPNLINGLIEPPYFSCSIHVDIARVAKEAHIKSESKDARLTKASLKALVQQDLHERRRRDAVSMYFREIRELFKIGLPDKEALVKLAAQFGKDAKYRQALVDCERDINAGDFESVRKRLDKLKELETPRSSSQSLPIYPLHKFLNQSSQSDPEKHFLAYPIIPKRGAVLLYGPPKSLKSWLAAALAMDIASGSGKAVGSFNVRHPANVLYVQVEDTDALTRDRLNTLKENQRSNRALMHLKVMSRHNLNLADPKTLAEFTAAVRRIRPELIVLDVFRRLFRGNISDSKDTAEYLQILDDLRDNEGCAILLVHHSKKAETNEISAMALGSINLTAWADVLIYCKRKRRMGQASVADLQIESKAGFSDDQRLIVKVDSEAYPMVSVIEEHQGEIDVIVSCISQNPGLNQQELISQTGIAEKGLRVLLRSAVDEGLIQAERGNRKTLQYFPIG